MAKSISIKHPKLASRQVRDTSLAVLSLPWRMGGQASLHHLVFMVGKERPRGPSFPLTLNAALGEALVRSFVPSRLYEITQEFHKALITPPPRAQCPKNSRLVLKFCHDHKKGNKT